VGAGIVTSERWLESESGRPSRVGSTLACWLALRPDEEMIVIERVVCPILVGRAEEVSELEDALLATLRGDGQAVLIGGEAGVGKTRLVLETQKLGLRLGCRVLWGACSESALPLPYLPFLEAIGNHLRTISDVRALAEKLGPAARDLAVLFPELSSEPPGWDSGDPSEAKLRLFTSILSLLDAISADQTLLLVIEDIHWADSSTRELLDYLFRRLKASPLMIIATYRTDELHRRHPLAPLLQAWRRDKIADLIEPQRLNAQGVEDVMCAIFSETAMTGEFRDYLHDRSEGNPFVLEEMLKEAVERGAVFRTSEGWDRKAMSDIALPRSVAENILLRVERLELQQINVLQAAAVLGQSFPYAQLVKLVELDASVVQGAIEASLRQQLLDEDQASGRFKFRHALTHEAIYDDMIRPRREELHSRAADVLRELDDVAPIETARHLLEAHRTEEGVPLCLAAADSAMSRFAAHEAADLYERVLPEVSDHSQRSRVLCRLGEAQYRVGAYDASVASLEQGIAMLESEGAQAECGKFRLVLAVAFWESGDIDACHQQLLIARDELEPLGPSETLADTYVGLAWNEVNSLRGASAEALARQGMEIADAIGAQRERIRAANVLGAALVCLGRVSEGVELLDQTYKNAIAYGALWMADAMETNRILCAMHTGLNRDTESLVDAFRLNGRKPHKDMWLAWFDSYFAHAAGDLLRALDIVVAISTQARESRSWAEIVDLESARILLDMDRIDDARSHIQLCDPIDDESVAWKMTEEMRALLYLRDATGAATIARQLVSGDRDWFLPAWILELVVEALLAAGALDEAADLIANPDTSLQSDDLRPFLDRAQGRVALARGDANQARQRLEATCEAMADLGEVMETLATLVPLARAQAASGDVPAAKATLDRTVALATRCGANLHFRLAVEAATELGVEVQVAAVEVSESAPRGDSVATLGDEVLVIGHPVVLIAVLGDDAKVEAPGAADEKVHSFARWAERQVAERDGHVLLQASDTITAIFDSSAAAYDSGRNAIETAIALRDKAGLWALELRVFVHLASRARSVAGGLIAASHVEPADTLAQRLLTQVHPGDIVLDVNVYRDLAGWLSDHSDRVHADQLATSADSHPTELYRLVYRNSNEVRSAGTEGAVSTPVVPETAFRKEGDYWGIAFGGKTIRLRHSKGLQDIAWLLATSGRELAAVDLASGDGPQTAGRGGRIEDLGLGVESDIGELLDAEARAAYRARLSDLEEEIAEADSNNDPERASTAREERELLLGELGAAVGLGGHARRMLDPAERARKAVTGRIRDAISHIETAHPQLGRHLRRSIRTGSFCVYDPPEPTNWGL
jgi:hypothetical protein